ncbi:MAG TPA: hypothetical protein VF640_07825, partial [Acidimicrobiales bacterium]
MAELPLAEGPERDAPSSDHSAPDENGTAGQQPASVPAATDQPAEVETAALSSDVDAVQQAIARLEAATDADLAPLQESPLDVLESTETTGEGGTRQVSSDAALEGGAAELTADAAERASDGEPVTLELPSAEELAAAESAAGRGESEDARQSSDDQPTDEQATDEQATDDEGTEDEATDDAGDDEADSDDEDASDQGGEGDGRRRRRRRGGRRRRRGGSDDDRSEGSDEASDQEPSGDVPAAVTDTEEDSDDDAEDETSSDAEGDGSRRRRRRRRRRGEETAAAPDDPTEVVVRVREPRRGGKSAGAADSSGVTGIEGSTRMEAKRQRRREGREAGRRRVPILSEAEFLARREAVNRKMIIRQADDLSQIAVIEDDILVEHYVDRDSAASLIGNVYLGRVQNVLPSMEAAFIDIGRGRNAVLYAGEVDWDSFGAEGQGRKVERVLKSGQTILV